MFEPRPLGLGRGHRSDRHGVIERHTTLALSRSFLDPRDISTHWAVEEHGPQVLAFRQRRTEVCRARPAEQADRYADKLSDMLRQEAGSHANRSARSSNCSEPDRPRVMHGLPARTDIRKRSQGGRMRRTERRKTGSGIDVFHRTDRSPGAFQSRQTDSSAELGSASPSMTSK